MNKSEKAILEQELREGSYLGNVKLGPHCRCSVKTFPAVGWVHFLPFSRMTMFLGDFNALLRASVLLVAILACIDSLTLDV